MSQKLVTFWVFQPLPRNRIAGTPERGWRPDLCCIVVIVTTMQSTNLSVLWRVEQPNGRTASARLVPSGGKARLIWYSNREVVGSEEFDDLSSAMNRAEELRVLVRVAGF